MFSNATGAAASTRPSAWMTVPWWENHTTGACSSSGGARALLLTAGRLRNVASGRRALWILLRPAPRASCSLLGGALACLLLAFLRRHAALLRRSGSPTRNTCLPPASTRSQPGPSLRPQPRPPPRRAGGDRDRALLIGAAAAVRMPGIVLVAWAGEEPVGRFLALAPRRKATGGTAVWREWARVAAALAAASALAGR